MRNPAPESWSLHESPGNLVLGGNKTSLDTTLAPPLLSAADCTICHAA
ncbi:hypothetical protein [Paenibacillus sp. PL91]